MRINVNQLWLCRDILASFSTTRTKYTPEMTNNCVLCGDPTTKVLCEDCEIFCHTGKPPQRKVNIVSERPSCKVYGCKFDVFKYGLCVQHQPSNELPPENHADALVRCVVCDKQLVGANKALRLCSEHQNQLDSNDAPKRKCQYPNGCSRTPRNKLDMYCCRHSEQSRIKRAQYDRRRKEPAFLKDVERLDQAL